MTRVLSIGNDGKVGIGTGTAGPAYTFDVEDRYFLDRKTGEVDKYKVRKIPAEKYKLKKDHVVF